MPLPLFALMLCVFSVGTAESVIAGILPQIAGDLGVSVPAVGLLVSGYALTVVVGGPLVTLLTGRIPRKSLVLGLIAVFVAGNLIAAVADDYAVLLAGRVVSALAHCTMFAVCIVIANGLVGAGRQGSAVARVALGLNLATVVGVPIGTVLGQEFGWRSTFWAVLLMSVVSALLVFGFVPAVPGPSSAGAVGELAVLRDRRVWSAVTMTVFASAGAFAAYTFIAPLLTEVGGFGPVALTTLLFVFGGGSIVGNLVGGRLVDRAVLPALVSTVAALTLSLLFLAVVAPVRPLAAVAVLLFGASYFSIIPALQARIMTAAGARAPTLALAVNISAFNIGIGGGAWLGGRVIDAGLGYRAVVLVGAAAVVVSVLVAIRELIVARARDTSTVSREHQLV
ncbi:MFS transporter [Micromonospora sp. WMMD882]|uniref:MFS transporter n=1 Tax=Micromonospora sp. WMMD882 TaxID=3015151 RepID=UPI00248BDC8C|nr:MFS transporter [Micromonospora sp. WMMD882]WBB80511.1 MFS transporter [Micromonospora sp. WMMD882]